MYSSSGGQFGLWRSQELAVHHNQPGINHYMQNTREEYNDPYILHQQLFLSLLSTFAPMELVEKISFIASPLKEAVSIASRQKETDIHC
jgi:hypothetical protein